MKAVGWNKCSIVGSVNGTGDGILLGLADGSIGCYSTVYVVSTNYAINNMH